MRMKKEKDERVSVVSEEREEEEGRRDCCWR